VPGKVFHYRRGVR
jgi:hypothetical protein